MTALILATVLAQSAAAQPVPAKAMRDLTIHDILARGRATIAALGTYKATLVKQERVGGKFLEAQTIELTLREAPFAVYASYVDGLNKGRRLLYSEALRKDELRVREPGALGLFGAVWVGIDSSLARGDTNYRASRLGFGSVLDGIADDDRAAAKFGGYQRTDEGEKDGLWCIRFDAPANATGLFGDTVRLCFDSRGLPMRLETRDKQGPRELLRYSNVEPVKVPDEFFTLKGVSL